MGSIYMFIHFKCTENSVAEWDRSIFLASIFSLFILFYTLIGVVLIPIIHEDNLRPLIFFLFFFLFFYLFIYFGSLNFTYLSTVKVFAIISNF